MNKELRFLEIAAQWEIEQGLIVTFRDLSIYRNQDFKCADCNYDLSHGDIAPSVIIKGRAYCWRCENNKQCERCGIRKQNIYTYPDGNICRECHFEKNSTKTKSLFDP